MTHYEPRPGTLPHRAIAYLREQGATAPGAEVASAAICDALQTDLTTLAKAMALPRTHGLVHARRIAGRGQGYWWHLGEAAPPDGAQTVAALLQAVRALTTQLHAAQRIIANYCMEQAKS